MKFAVKSGVSSCRARLFAFGILLLTGLSLSAVAQVPAGDVRIHYHRPDGGEWRLGRGNRRVLGSDGEDMFRRRSLRNYLDRCYEAVSSFGQRLDEARIVGGVAEGLSDFVDRAGQGPFIIDICSGFPNPCLEFFSTDDFASVIKKHLENAKWLGL